MENEKTKKAWWPTSKRGKNALLLLVICFCLIGFIPMIPTISDIRIIRIITSFIPFLLFVVLSIMGLIYSGKAFFKHKDRAILLLIAFILYCLLCALILIFIIGEFLFPH